MQVSGKPYRTLWLGDDGRSVDVIDQTKLPAEFCVLRLTTTNDVAHAIRTMQVRGAPLIGVAAAYGICLAMVSDGSDQALDDARDRLLATRPTAVNLRWALDVMRATLRRIPPDERVAAAYALAARAR